MGDRTLALQQVSKAIRADPTLSDAQLHAVLWRWQSGDSSGARYGLQTLLKQDSSLAAALGLRGMMSWWQGRDIEAVALMRRALVIDSNYLPAWRVMGWDAANRMDQSEVDLALSRIRALNRNDWAVPVIEAVIAASGNPRKSLAAWRDLVRSQ
jgi:Tfp pilus assembly protein PilF